MRKRFFWIWSAISYQRSVFKVQSSEFRVVTLLTARGSLLVARCVRDCSGILCERNGEWDLGTGIWERGEMKRAKI